jgi:arsenate reductase-like glutaredoxin family protein
MSELFVANGRKVEHFDLKKKRPDDDILAGLLLGRSGTLRAPVIRTGKKLVVGFNADIYREVFGATKETS